MSVREILELADGGSVELRRVRGKGTGFVLQDREGSSTGTYFTPAELRRLALRALQLAETDEAITEAESEGRRNG